MQLIIKDWLCPISVNFEATHFIFVLYKLQLCIIIFIFIF